jgi:hypothetical protein
MSKPGLAFVDLGINVYVHEASAGLLRWGRASRYSSVIRQN